MKMNCFWCVSKFNLYLNPKHKSVPTDIVTISKNYYYSGKVIWEIVH